MSLFPKPTAQGSRLVGSVSRSRLRIARRQLPYHWQALLGSSMGPKTQRRHVNDTVGDVARGKPYHWQAFAASCIFRRRTANDAVVTTDCGLPHHWHDIGTEFLIFHCFATKMLFCFVNPWFRCGSAPFYLYIPVPVSKHDLKHFSKHNTLHWDRISNFSLFCHQNVTFVL